MISCSSNFNFLPSRFWVTNKSNRNMTETMKTYLNYRTETHDHQTRCVDVSAKLRRRRDHFVFSPVFLEEREWRTERICFKYMMSGSITYLIDSSFPYNTYLNKKNIPWLIKRARSMVIESRRSMAIEPLTLWWCWSQDISSG